MEEVNLNWPNQRPTMYRLNDESYIEEYNKLDDNKFQIILALQQLEEATSKQIATLTKLDEVDVSMDIFILKEKGLLK